MGFFRINGQKPVEIKVGNSRVAQIMLNGSVIYPEVEIDWSKAAVIILKRGTYRNGVTNCIYLKAPNQYGEDGTVDAVVDWGDGTIEYVGSGMYVLSHEYNVYDNVNKEYTVKIFASSFGGFEYGWWIKSGSEGEITGNNAQIGLLSLVTMGKMPGLTKSSMREAFGQCVDLHTIQAGALDNCVNCEDFKSIFVNTGLETIPSGLFAKCKAATTFESAFASSAIKSLPANLFANLTKVETFISAFASTELTSTGSGTFANCTAAQIFTSAFHGCRELMSISADIFAGCAAATHFMNTFAADRKLATIPASLFNGCPNIDNFDSTFQFCEAITSSVPTLWTRENVSWHRSCFGKCTKAANYEQIPSNWK